jgi:hypothetical protein
MSLLKRAVKEGWMPWREPFVEGGRGANRGMKIEDLEAVEQNACGYDRKRQTSLVFRSFRVVAAGPADDRDPRSAELCLSPFDVKIA